MKTETELPSFEAFLKAWQLAGSPEWMPEGYLGFPVHSCQTVRIDSDSLPADVQARLPKVESNNVHVGALLHVSWSRDHGPVLDVAYSAYSNGWSQFAVATYLPRTSAWVHPTEVHTYGYPES